MKVYLFYIFCLKNGYGLISLSIMIVYSVNIAVVSQKTYILRNTI